jgi:O-antigen polysaccharide polymerase Wzy
MDKILLLLPIDLIIVAACVLVLLRRGRLAHSHPATIYLFFHIYMVTLRLAALATGALTLFADWGLQFGPVTYDEIARAAVMMDAALVLVTIASLSASRHDLRKNGPPPQPGQEGPKNLSLGIIWMVCAVVIPIGMIGLLTLADLPQFRGLAFVRDALGRWQSSSWVSITVTWVGLGLLALMYWYGFKPWLMIPMVLYLLLMGYQGYHRFRIIIPAILLIQIYLDRHQQRWPSPRVFVVLVALILLFYPLKTIGQMAQVGAGPTEIATASADIIGEALSGRAGDQQFLDQFASVLTLVDENGVFYYGRTYLALFTLPIPRQWWPDKPELAAYLSDISRPWRPMGEAGMIATYLGESYANFGYIGAAIIAYLLAYWLARAYFRAYRSNYFTAVHFGYLLIASNLLQVYRDGLVSIVVFTFVNMMPLTLIVLLHLLRLKPRPRWSPGPGSSRPPASSAANPGLLPKTTVGGLPPTGRHTAKYRSSVGGEDRALVRAGGAMGQDDK